MLEVMGIEKLDDMTVRQVPAATLAFIGDGVFDMYIRSMLVKASPRLGSHALNSKKIKCVKASMQAHIAISLMPQLTEEETGVLKRGRNTKSNTVAKNAKLSDYKYATGFEALLGHLALLGQDDRLRDLLSQSYALCKQELGDQL